MTEGDQLDNDTRTEVLFGRMMLLKLRQSISRLDGSAYAELRSDDDATEVSHPVVKAVLCLLQPDQKGIYEDWQKCQPVSWENAVLYLVKNGSRYSEALIALTVLSWIKVICSSSSVF